MSPYITSASKKKVSPHNFLRKDCLCRRKWASDLFRGARSEYQYLSWYPGVVKEAKIKDVRRGGFWGIMSGKKWSKYTWQPYRTYRPAVKSKDLEKPQHFFSGHALSLAEAYFWFRVVWSVNDRILFHDFYWRSQLLFLPASGLDIGQEEQLKTPLSVIVCAQTACLSSFP